MAEESKSTKGTSAKSTSTKGKVAGAVGQVRTRVAQLLWLICVVCALFLALGALLIALGANDKNALVEFVKDGADTVDLGIFTLRDGVKQFRGEGAEVKNALFNWGLGAVFWLVLGRILDRIVRP